MRETALLFLCVLFFIGCQSAQRAVVPDIGDGADKTRNAIAELGDRQTESALTGQRIETDSGSVASGLANLERAIADGAEYPDDIAEILRAVRTRPVEKTE